VGMGAAAAAAAVVEKIDALEDPFPPRKEWILDPSRSMWGIADQGDRVDGGGHRGGAPYSVVYAGDYNWVYLKGLNPAVSRKQVCEFLLLFGPVSSLRLRVTRKQTPGQQDPQPIRPTDDKKGAGVEEDGEWEQDRCDRCEAYAQFAKTADAAKAVMVLHGMALSLTHDQLRVGDKALPRREVTDFCSCFFEACTYCEGDRRRRVRVPVALRGRGFVLRRVVTVRVIAITCF
jgi:hypothetical protein